MKKLVLLILAAFGLTVSGFAQYKYAPTKQVDSSNIYWGVAYKNPYGWLENLKDPEVESWFKTQANFTDSLLAQIPGQDQLVKELEALNYSTAVRYRNIQKVEGKYFYYKLKAGEDVPKIYYKDIKTGRETKVFDPQIYFKGINVTVSYTSNYNGTLLILGVTEQGKEIGDFRILDVATQKLLPDILPHSMFADFVKGKADRILYFQLKNYDVRDPENALNPTTMLHKLGTPVSSDKIVLSNTKYPQLLDSVGWVSIKTFDKSPYIFAEKSTSSFYRQVYYAPANELESDRINWKIFCTTNDEISKFWVDGSDIYYLTSKGSEYFNVLKTSLPNSDLLKSQNILTGSEDWKISFYGEDPEVYKAQDYLIINLSKNDIQSKNIAYNFRTRKEATLDIPITGNFTVIPFSENDNECRATNFGWTSPNTYYNYDLNLNKFSKGAFYVESNYPGLKDVTYEEVEVVSHDGVSVPLSIIYDKTKLKKDGSNILLMTGYGAYGISMSPNFNPTLLPFLKRGTIYAIAHVRGGGEKGKNWHNDGMKLTKPNTWKDFNACADFLIKNKYTSASKLGCEGGSAGGILIGRAITERPELYKVAIATAGMMNPLHSVTLSNAQGNFAEYGTITDSLEFKALLEMDPMYHIKKGVKYPAQLITTGYNDPRVPSYIPAKFAAEMQTVNDAKVPTLLMVDYNSGHFGNSDQQAFYKQTAKQYAFLFWQTGHPDFQPK